jgi:DNA invertase Pin-like site-specific DNA recombinase
MKVRQIAGTGGMGVAARVHVRSLIDKSAVIISVSIKDFCIYLILILTIDILMVHFIYKHRFNTFATETHMKRSTSKTITKAIGYSRVSTDDQTLSVDAQRARLESWCAERRIELVAVHEDIGISGGADLDKRPALMAALDALEPGMVLVAVKRDRIARDAMNAAMIERLAERAGAQVLTCDGAGEGDSPEAKLMRTMIDAFVEYERAIIRARTKVAMGHKRNRDERIRAISPLGKRWPLMVFIPRIRIESPRCGCTA